MKKILLVSLFSILTFNVMAQEKIVQTAGRDQLGDFAPKFAELNDDVLFGEVWSRTDKLGLRDRSLVTITSLISQGITDSSLGFHHHPHRDCGDNHPYRILRGLAEGVGGFPPRQRRVGGGYARRGCESGLPAGDDIPHR